MIRKKKTASIIPAIFLSLLVLSIATLFAASTEGPGSLHAPILVSLAAGLIFGAAAQKARACFAGGIRDVILMKNFDLFLSVIAGLFGVMLVYNLVSGNFKPGFEGQPIAHAETLWNILGTYTVGFAAVLAGGCPLRQLILAGQGSSDAAVNVLGMLVGAAPVPQLWPGFQRNRNHACGTDHVYRMYCGALCCGCFLYEKNKNNS